MALEPRYPRWMDADEVVIARVGTFDVSRTSKGIFFVNDIAGSNSVGFLLRTQVASMRDRVTEEELNQIRAIAALL